MRAPTVKETGTEQIEVETEAVKEEELAEETEEMPQPTEEPAEGKLIGEESEHMPRPREDIETETEKTLEEVETTELEKSTEEETEAQSTEKAEIEDTKEHVDEIQTADVQGQKEIEPKNEEEEDHTSEKVAVVAAALLGTGAAIGIGAAIISECTEDKTLASEPVDTKPITKAKFREDLEKEAVKEPSKEPDTEDGTGEPEELEREDMQKEVSEEAERVETETIPEKALIEKPIEPEKEEVGGDAESAEQPDIETVPKERPCEDQVEGRKEPEKEEREGPSEVPEEVVEEQKEGEMITGALEESEGEEFQPQEIGEQAEEKEVVEEEPKEPVGQKEIEKPCETVGKEPEPQQEATEEEPKLEHEMFEQTEESPEKAETDFTDKIDKCSETIEDEEDQKLESEQKYIEPAEETEREEFEKEREQKEIEELSEKIKDEEVDEETEKQEFQEQDEQEIESEKVEEEPLEEEFLETTDVPGKDEIKQEIGQKASEEEPEKYEIVQERQETKESSTEEIKEMEDFKDASECLKEEITDDIVEDTKVMEDLESSIETKQSDQTEQEKRTTFEPEETVALTQGTVEQEDFTEDLSEKLEPTSESKEKEAETICDTDEDEHEKEDKSEKEDFVDSTITAVTTEDSDALEKLSVIESAEQKSGEKAIIDTLEKPIGVESLAERLAVDIIHEVKDSQKKVETEVVVGQVDVSGPVESLEKEVIKDLEVESQGSDLIEKAEIEDISDVGEGSGEDLDEIAPDKETIIEKSLEEEVESKPPVAGESELVDSQVCKDDEEKEKKWAGDDPMQRSVDSEPEKGIMDSSERAKDSLKSPDEDGSFPEPEQVHFDSEESGSECSSKEEYEEKSEHESLMDIHLTPSESSDNEDDLPESDKALLESAFLPEEDIPVPPEGETVQEEEKKEEHPTESGKETQTQQKETIVGAVTVQSTIEVLDHSIDISDAAKQQQDVYHHEEVVSYSVTTVEDSAPGIDIEEAAEEDRHYEEEDTREEGTGGGLGAPEIAIQAASPLTQSPSSDPEVYEPKGFSGVVVDEYERETVAEAAAILEGEEEAEEAGDAAPLAEAPEVEREHGFLDEPVYVHKQVASTASVEAFRGSEPPSDVDSGADVMVESSDRPLSPSDYVLEPDVSETDAEPEGRIEADTSQQIFIEQSIQKARTPSLGTPGDERPPSPSDYMLVVDQSEGSSHKDGISLDSYQAAELEEDKPVEPKPVIEEQDETAEKRSPEQVVSPVHPYEPSPPLGLPHPSAEAFTTGS